MKGQIIFIQRKSLHRLFEYINATMKHRMICCSWDKLDHSCSYSHLSLLLPQSELFFICSWRFILTMNHFHIRNMWLQTYSQFLILKCHFNLQLLHCHFHFLILKSQFHFLMLQLKKEEEEAERAAAAGQRGNSAPTRRPHPRLQNQVDIMEAWMN